MTSEPINIMNYDVRDRTHSKDSDAFLAEIVTFESQSQKELTNLPDKIVAKPLAIMVGIDQKDSDTDEVRSACGVPSLAKMEATDAHQKENPKLHHLGMAKLKLTSLSCSHRAKQHRAHQRHNHLTH